MVLLAIIAAPSRAATVTISIDGMRFVSAAVSVKRGDTVIWVNRDLVPHTATAADAFDSQATAPGTSWSYVARKPGRYDDVCGLHPMMKATLRVE